MRITAEQVETAVRDVVLEGKPGELINWQRVAELLTERLEDSLVGRVPANAAARQIAPAGRCRVCDCTDDFACLVEGERDDPEGARSCGWADETHTLCDNPVCLDTVAEAPFVPAQAAVQ